MIHRYTDRHPAGSRPEKGCRGVQSDSIYRPLNLPTFQPLPRSKPKPRLKSVATVEPILTHLPQLYSTDAPLFMDVAEHTYMVCDVERRCASINSSQGQGCSAFIPRTLFLIFFAATALHWFGLARLMAPTVPVSVPPLPLLPLLPPFPPRQHTKLDRIFVSFRPCSPAPSGPTPCVPLLRILISSNRPATYVPPMTASATSDRPGQSGMGRAAKYSASGLGHSLAHNPGCWLCVIGCMRLRMIVPGIERPLLL